MSIRYRLATSEDIEEQKIMEFALAALNDATMLPKFAENVGEDLADRISSAKLGNFIIAEDEEDNQFIGYLELEKIEKDYHIIGLYVLPDYRHKSIAHELLKRAEDRCQPDEHIRVNAYSKRELGLYHNLGFKTNYHALFYKKDS